MSRREGFSLIEVVVALMILSVSVLGIQLVAASMLHRMTTGHLQLTAVQLAEDRLDRIRLEPNYNLVPGYAGTESTVTGFPGYQRITTVVRDSTMGPRGAIDRRMITVVVSATGLLAPVRRTLVLGAP